MKSLVKRIAGVVLAAMLTLTPVMMTGMVWAEGEDGGSQSGSQPPETSILPNDMDIEGILRLVLKILVYGLGAAATLGVVIAGIMYLTARDNEQQVATAKKRLYEVVIGLVAWAVMFTVLNWLVPGGVTL